MNQVLCSGLRSSVLTKNAAGIHLFESMEQTPVVTEALSMLSSLSPGLAPPAPATPLGPPPPVDDAGDAAAVNLAS